MGHKRSIGPSTSPGTHNFLVNVSDVSIGESQYLAKLKPKTRTNVLLKLSDVGASEGLIALLVGSS